MEKTERILWLDRILIAIPPKTLSSNDIPVPSGIRYYKPNRQTDFFFLLRKIKKTKKKKEQNPCNLHTLKGSGSRRPQHPPQRGETEWVAECHKLYPRGSGSTQLTMRALPQGHSLCEGVSHGHCNLPLGGGRLQTPQPPTKGVSHHLYESGGRSMPLPLWGGGDEVTHLLRETTHNPFTPYLFFRRITFFGNLCLGYIIIIL